LLKGEPDGIIPGVVRRLYKAMHLALAGWMSLVGLVSGVSAFSFFSR
jgi:hypothetical protein